MDTPLISIVVPIYNIKEYLVGCVNSILEQSYKNIEIILVDDGSKDGSGNICDEYAKKDHRIRVIHQKNGGLSEARNAGINAAGGQYITFVDGDDALDTDAIKYLYKLQEKKQADISICAFAMVSGKKIKNIGSQYRTKTLNPSQCLERMLMGEGFDLTAWGKLYPKSFFDKIKFPANKLHEDVGTTYKLVMRSKKIAYGPDPKYLYYQRKNSIVQSNFSVKKMDLICLTDEMCDEIDARYPELKNVTNRRRVRARIAILARVCGDKRFADIEKQMIDYIKKNRELILKNQKASVQDKAAVIALLINKRAFKLLWKSYELFCK